MKSRKGFGEVIRHGEIDGLLLVIPIQVNATEDFAITVVCHIIVLWEAVNEMIGVGLANDFDTKVIDNKIESSGTRDVMEKSRGMTGGNISVVGEMLDELDIC